MLTQYDITLRFSLDSKLNKEKFRAMLEEYINSMMTQFEGERPDRVTYVGSYHLQVSD